MPATNRARPKRPSPFALPQRRKVYESRSSIMGLASRRKTWTACSPTALRLDSRGMALVCTAAHSRLRSWEGPCVRKATDRDLAPHSSSNCPTCEGTPPMHDSNPPSRRILIIDDNAAIHHDFRKVLGVQADQSSQAVLDLLEADLFGTALATAARPNFEIDSAHQGQEGVKMAGQAVAEGRPYVMAFVD